MPPVPSRGRVSTFFAYPSEESSDAGLVFLADRDEADWARLLGFTETIRFAAGDTIIEAGESDRALYIVVEGSLEVLVPEDGGRARRGGTIAPRSVVGEVAFLDARPRSATIRALSAGELVRLTFEAFEVLAARYPELGRAVLVDLGRILAGRLREADAALAAARGT